jgi:hypothetical protein
MAVLLLPSLMKGGARGRVAMVSNPLVISPFIRGEKRESCLIR